MSKSDAWEQDILKLLFRAQPILNVADNAVSAPLGFLYISLHTADPLLNEATGNQATTEVNYTPYVRAAVVRDVPSWTLAGSAMSPAANIQFVAGTSGTTPTATHFGIGSVASTGTGKLFYSGTVTPNIVCGNGITPQLTTASTITED